MLLCFRYVSQQWFGCPQSSLFQFPFLNDECRLPPLAGVEFHFLSLRRRTYCMRCLPIDCSLSSVFKFRFDPHTGDVRRHNSRCQFFDLICFCFVFLYRALAMNWFTWQIKCIYIVFVLFNVTFPFLWLIWHSHINKFWGMTYWNSNIKYDRL